MAKPPVVRGPSVKCQSTTGVAKRRHVAFMKAKPIYNKGNLSTKKAHLEHKKTVLGPIFCRFIIMRP